MIRAKYIHKKPVYPLEILYKANIKLLLFYLRKQCLQKKTFVLLNVYSKAQVKKIEK